MGGTREVGVKEARETVVEGPKLSLSCCCLTANGVPRPALVTACVVTIVLFASDSFWALVNDKLVPILMLFCLFGPWGITAAKT